MDANDEENEEFQVELYPECKFDPLNQIDLVPFIADFMRTMHAQAQQQQQGGFWGAVINALNKTDQTRLKAALAYTPPATYKPTANSNPFAAASSSSASASASPKRT
jgi:hypothetical protein